MEKKITGKVKIFEYDEKAHKLVEVGDVEISDKSEKETKEEIPRSKEPEHDTERKEDLSEEEKIERKRQKSRGYSKKSYNKNKDVKKKYYQEHKEELKRKEREKYSNLPPEEKHKRLEYTRRRSYIKKHGTEEGFVERPFV